MMVSEVIAYQVSLDYVPVTFWRRTIWMAWAARGRPALWPQR
jgi:hypothetical protein